MLFRVYKCFARRKATPKTLNTKKENDWAMVEPNMYHGNAPPPDDRARRPTPDADFIGKISKNVNNVAANLRIMEERYANLRNKSQVSEQNMIAFEKELRNDIKFLSEDMVDLKRELNDIRDKLRLISSEMKNLVNKNDFKIMERYVDLWQPMNFVTRAELNRWIADKDKAENTPKK
jgi:hypothetical protein